MKGAAISSTASHFFGYSVSFRPHLQDIRVSPNVGAYFVQFGVSFDEVANLQPTFRSPKVKGIPGLQLIHGPSKSAS
jgi:hypothetical protein